MPRTFVFAVCFFVLATIAHHRVAHAREPVCVDSVYFAKPVSDPEYRVWYTAAHSIGDLVMAVSNSGVFGASWLWQPDYFTGLIYEYGSEYPKFSQVNQLRHATFWIGGIRGGDTLVSIGLTSGLINTPLYELNPDPYPGGGLQYRSTTDPTSPYFEDAVSEQDIIAVYNDTCVWFYAMDQFDEGREHIPMYIEVTQRSYAWSADITDDFVLFEMTVENIGDVPIRDAYFGVVTRPQVGFNITYG